MPKTTRDPYDFYLEGFARVRSGSGSLIDREAFATQSETGARRYLTTEEAAHFALGVHDGCGTSDPRQKNAVKTDVDTLLGND